MILKKILILSSQSEILNKNFIIKKVIATAPIDIINPASL